MARGYTLSEAYAELQRARALVGYEGSFTHRAAHVAAARCYLEDEMETGAADAAAFTAADAAVRAAEEELRLEQHPN